MGHSRFNKLIGVLINTTFLVLVSFLGTEKILAAEGYPGPEMVDSYIEWEPGGGPEGADCLLRGVNLNDLTGFAGAIITTGCVTARAGDFWSRFVIQRGTPAQISTLLELWESLGNEFRGEILVDEGTPQESLYSISFWKALVRDDSGAPKILPASLLFPGDARQMLVFIAPLPPERVGLHTAKLTVVEPNGIFNFGIVQWEVIPR